MLFIDTCVTCDVRSHTSATGQFLHMSDRLQNECLVVDVFAFEVLQHALGKWVQRVPDRMSRQGNL